MKRIPLREMLDTCGRLYGLRTNDKTFQCKLALIRWEYNTYGLVSPGIVRIHKVRAPRGGTHCTHATLRFKLLIMDMRQSCYARMFGSLRFAFPASRTRIETDRFSLSRDATTRPPV